MVFSCRRWWVVRNGPLISPYPATVRTDSQPDPDVCSPYGQSRWRRRELVVVGCPLPGSPLHPTRRPPASTASGCCRTVRSASGSPSTASRSASKPGAMRPLRSPSPHTCAAVEVPRAAPRPGSSRAGRGAAGRAGSTPCGLIGAMPGVGAGDHQRAPAAISRRVLAIIAGRSGAAARAAGRARRRPGAMPEGRADRDPPATMRATRSGGCVDAVGRPERHVLHAVDPGRDARRRSPACACACAVTGRPCRCASSTSAASSSGVNCAHSCRCPASGCRRWPSP